MVFEIILKKGISEAFVSLISFSYHLKWIELQIEALANRRNPVLGRAEKQDVDGCWKERKLRHQMTSCEFLLEIQHRNCLGTQSTC